MANYYPFGMMEPGRQWAVDSSLFGYNDKEKTDEITGRGNSYDFGERMYDARIARFWSLDPESAKYPEYSTYLYAADNPVFFEDKNGNGPDNHTFKGLLYSSNPEKAKALDEGEKYVANHYGVEAGVAGVALPVIIYFTPEIIAAGPAIANWWLRTDPDGSKTAGTIMGIADPDPMADYPGFMDDIVRVAKPLLVKYGEKIGKLEILGKALQKEIDFGKELTEKGFDVTVRGTAAKGNDLIVNGVKVEYKELEQATENAVMSNVKKGLEQGEGKVVVDGRQVGLTGKSASNAIDRLIGAGRLKDKSYQIHILTKEGEKIFTSPSPTKSK